MMKFLRRIFLSVFLLISLSGNFAQAQNSTFTIDLSIVGDCLLATEDGKIYPSSFSWYAKNAGAEYFFKKVSHIFKEDDYTIANLENVLTDRPLSPIDKGKGEAYWFKAPTSNTNILKKASIEAVSIANNHTNDYGYAGYLDTTKALDKAGVIWGSDEKTIYLTKNEYTVAIIPASLYAGSQTKRIIDRIKEVSKKSDYQIVYFHGGKEGVYEPEAWKVKACHQLVDAGADLVIGNHPHRLQPIEVYKGVNIIYSLGNFCFGGNVHMTSNRTVIYKTILTIENNKLAKEETILIPCYIQDDTKYVNNWQPSVITKAQEKALVFDFLFNKAKYPHVRVEEDKKSVSESKNLLNVNMREPNGNKVIIQENSGYIVKVY